MECTQRLRVSRVVAAPAERVVALLADPSRHPEFDGSGTLRAAHTGTTITAVGNLFVMDLYADDLGEYQSQSKVTSYERDRVIGWSPGPLSEEPFGHTFTYPLEPLADAGTRVTQTYDWSAVPDERLVGKLPRVSQDELARSRDLLVQAVARLP